MRMILGVLGLVLLTLGSVSHADPTHSALFLSTLALGAVPRQEVRWKKITKADYSNFVSKTVEDIRTREQNLSRDRNEWDKVRNDFSDRIEKGRRELVDVECVEVQTDQTSPDAQGRVQVANPTYHSYKATVRLDFSGKEEGKVTFLTSSDRWPDSYVLANERFLVGWDFANVVGNIPQAPVLLGTLSSQDRHGDNAIGGAGSKTSTAIHSIGSKDLAFHTEFIDSVPAAHQVTDANSGIRYELRKTAIWCR